MNGWVNQWEILVIQKQFQNENERGGNAGEYGGDGMSAKTIIESGIKYTMQHLRA